MSQSHPPIQDAVDRFLSGDPPAGEALCVALDPLIRAAVHRILGESDADEDDIVQDSLMAVLGYLERTGTAPRNIEAFASTIARNRCVNLLHWRRRRLASDVDRLADQIPNLAASPLDLIGEQQTQELLAAVLEKLDAPCRALLDAIYRAERGIEQIRSELGLKTVQAVYYRRDVCIKKAQRILNQELLSGPRVGRGEPRRKAVDADG